MRLPSHNVLHVVCVCHSDNDFYLFFRHALVRQSCSTYWSGEEYGEAACSCKFVKINISFGNELNMTEIIAQIITGTVIVYNATKIEAKAAPHGYLFISLPLIEYYLGI